MPLENPGAFGIEHLTGIVKTVEREMKAGFRRLERAVKAIATRAELDALKASLVQAISDATTRVTTDIQQLRDQLAAGNPISDADLADLQNDIAAVGNIDPSVVPTPPPTP